ncbi:hypothetical protein HMPREF9124_2321 [Oribacterium sp. oral taxon 108 str. F0425]|nr:hypothetical protein HMPREF9124_2321 [Oribacterium sp. oral taxon 108 str. F0425]
MCYLVHLACTESGVNFIIEELKNREKAVKSKDKIKRERITSVSV